MTGRVAQQAPQRAVAAESATRRAPAAVRAPVPLHAAGLPAPTTRQRLATVFAPEPEHAPVDVETAKAEPVPESSGAVEDDRGAPEPDDAGESQTGVTVDGTADVGWTTRERIARRALAGEPAGVEPMAAPASEAGLVDVSKPAERPRPEPVEVPPELDVEEAVGLAVVPDVEKRHLAALATLPFEGVEAHAAPGDPDAAAGRPDTPALTLVPIETEVKAEVPARTIEAVARGPPATAGLESADLGLSRTPIVQTKLAVSSPGDPLELEADAVAARVLRDATPAPPSRGGGAAVGRVQRAQPPIRGPPAAAGAFPRSVASVLAAPGGGAALDPGVRARIEPHVGIDLGHVRIRRGPDAAAAARDLHARAFTSGSTIFLAAESSPGDVALMAHEAAHVAQQGTVAAARTTVMRDVTDYLPDVSVDDLIPDWILDGVRDTVRAIPGYTLLTYVTGADPLTGETVSVGPADLVETLLTYGPFGEAVGAVLQAIDVLGEIFAFVMENLEAHGLTFARIERDIGNAWDELSVTNGIAGNVAIVRRYVDAFLDDVSSFVSSIVDRVLEIVRAVVAEVAEPLLEVDPIGPVWSLTKKVLHYDPLRGTEVKAPTAEIIADFLRLIGEEQRLAQMEERGTLQTTADWLDTQLVIFMSLVIELGMLFNDAWQAIQPENLPDLLTNLADLAQRAFGLVVRVGEFAATVILQVLELIKDALLGWLSEHAHSVPGFHLLTVIIEQNPFTGELVPRTAENLIKGFITLMPGGEETYAQLAESGVIGNAAARIEGEVRRLGISLELITGIFVGIWDTLTLDDLLDPIGAFMRVLDLFGEPLSRLLEFVAVVIEVVVTLILALMHFPSDLLASVVSNTVAAIRDIRRDPVGFLLNMMEALKAGFVAFFDNIGKYLLDGLVAWLFRGLGKLGITLPTDFSLGSILDLVFQVLGLTVDHLWEKLAEHIGAERVAMIRDAIDTLTGVWSFIQEVQRDGLAAIWRFIQDQLSSLWQTLLQTAMEWVMTQIITSGTIKLLSFLDPTFIMSVVNGCIALFNAVQAAIEYLRDMLEILNLYVGTLAQVAAGNIVPGAEMIEAGLAAVVPVAIGFLAYLLGIDDVPDRIADIVRGLRETIDRALNWLIEQALRLGQAALNALGLGGKKEEAPEPGEAAEGGANEVFFEADGVRHRLYREGPDPSSATPMVNPEPARTVQAVLDEMEPRILTDLPIRDDRRKAEQALSDARAVLRTLAVPPPAGGELPELEPHLGTLYGLLGHPEVPPTVVAGHLDAVGTHVTAAPLTRKAGNTQGASSTSNAHVEQQRDIVKLNAALGKTAKGHSRIEWDAGHLLSARLHGPNASGNFTPVSKTGNSAILRKVEEPAITRLAANEGRNMLWWDAEVTPRTEPVLAHWADTLLIRFGEWDASKSDGRGPEIDHVTVQPRPDFTGTRTVGSLSEDGAERLAVLTGMSLQVARTVVEVREAALGPGGRFKDWFHVLELVANTGRTASGERLTTTVGTTLRELDRLWDAGKLVPYFGFDPDEEILKWLERMGH